MDFCMTVCGCVSSSVTSCTRQEIALHFSSQDQSSALVARFFLLAPEVQQPDNRGLNARIGATNRARATWRSAAQAQPVSSFSAAAARREPYDIPHRAELLTGCACLLAAAERRLTPPVLHPVPRRTASWFQNLHQRDVPA